MDHGFAKSISRVEPSLITSSFHTITSVYLVFVLIIIQPLIENHGSPVENYKGVCVCVYIK